MFDVVLNTSEIFDLLGLLESTELQFSQDLMLVGHLKNG